jgi:serine/threonine protein kinase
MFSAEPGPVKLDILKLLRTGWLIERQPATRKGARARVVDPPAGRLRAAVTLPLSGDEVGSAHRAGSSSKREPNRFHSPLRWLMREAPTQPASERYEIIREHARGGLGRVLEVHDHLLNRRVALKELLDGSPQAELRFLREAFITARLAHPAIIPLYEFGRWADGKPFYTMKMVGGASLAALLREPRFASLQRRLELLPNIRQVAMGISFAHRQGIVHRDLKPANLLIGNFGETLIIDWGLATDTSTADAETRSIENNYEVVATHLTLEGSVIGTPGYMPIEQAEGNRVDERADVYALGAVLYHLLTGVPPYDGESSAEVLSKLKSEVPVPIQQRAPGIPPALASLVARAMERRATDRFSSAEEFVRALDQYQLQAIPG